MAVLEIDPSCLCTPTNCSSV